MLLIGGAARNLAVTVDEIARLAVEWIRHGISNTVGNYWASNSNHEGAAPCKKVNVYIS
jgi:hypothetical protein